MKYPNITKEQAAALPAVLTPKQLSEAFGLSLRYVQTQCKGGGLHARRVAGRWFIPTAEALRLFGIEGA